MSTKQFTPDCHLEGLEGAQLASMPAVFAKTPTAAMRKVSKSLACTWAESNGAINIWITTDGTVKVERQRFCATQEKAEAPTVADLSAFIKRQYRLIK